MKGTQCLTAFSPFPSIRPSPIDSLQPGLNGLETQQVKNITYPCFHPGQSIEIAKDWIFFLVEFLVIF